MSISFPTRSGPRNGGQQGFPHRADACTCGKHQIVDADGGCVVCGRFTRETIAATWRERAQRRRRGTRR